MKTPPNRARRDAKEAGDAGRWPAKGQTVGPVDGSGWVHRPASDTFPQPVPTEHLSEGSLVALKYRVLSHLGDGGMGSVWEVRNERTGGSFALKVVAGDAAAIPSLTARLLREARAAGGIHHPNVVQIYDVGEMADGSPFLIMQLLRGESLQVRLETEPAGIAEALEFAIEMGRGLEAAHSEGVVHRDLKPANIFLHREASGERVVKILDFGVSKFDAGDDLLTTQEGLAIGTPSYMSPEQARGRGVDSRSDIWALGVVLFEMLTGERPFDSTTSMSTVLRILDGPIPLLSEKLDRPPPGITAIIHRCLSRDPAERPRGAAEVVRVLEAELALLTGAAPAASSGARSEVVDPTSRGERYSSRLAKEPTVSTSTEYDSIRTSSFMSWREGPKTRAAYRAAPIGMGAIAVVGLGLYISGVFSPADPTEAAAPPSIPAADAVPHAARTASSPPVVTAPVTMVAPPPDPPVDAAPASAQGTGDSSSPAVSPKIQRVREPTRPAAILRAKGSPASAARRTRPRGRLIDAKTSSPKPLDAPPEETVPEELEACTPESLAPHCFGGTD